VEPALGIEQVKKLVDNEVEERIAKEIAERILQ
jgi:hypothetical protein